MPIYLYQHPKKTKKIIEIIQGMNELHEYIDSEGVTWNRLYTVPQGVVGSKLDPFNQQQFIDKVGTSKGSMGDTWDRSAELSARRAEQAGGIDPVKAKYLDNYSKKRKGKEHPSVVQERAKNINVTI